MTTKYFHFFLVVLKVLLLRMPLEWLFYLTKKEVSAVVYTVLANTFNFFYPGHMISIQQHRKVVDIGKPKLFFSSKKKVNPITCRT